MMDAPQQHGVRDAASLYVGDVMHARMKPFTNRFRYRVFSLLIDIDRLDEANRQSAFFSVGRFNLLSWSPRDHGPRDGSNVRAHIDELLSKAGVNENAARVELLCYPRILGLVFNPLSVFYCYDANDGINALVYEVRNTFGMIHSYVAPVSAQQRRQSEIRQERDKLFHVSPFLDMTMRYRFRLQPPSERLRLRILETDATGPILAASFSGSRLDLTNSSALRVFLAIPLLTLKIVGGIHWEALKIWLKGARFHRSVPPASRASFGERRPAAQVVHDPTPPIADVLSRPNA